MIKKALSSIYTIALASVLIGCATSSFTQTGRVFRPLPKDAPVDVIMRATPSYEVEQIGIVSTTCGDPSHCLEEAIEVARQKGGDTLVLSSSSLGIGHNGQTYQIRTFEICRKKQ